MWRFKEVYYLDTIEFLISIIQNTFPWCIFQAFEYKNRKVNNRVVNKEKKKIIQLLLRLVNMSPRAYQIAEVDQ